MDYDRKVILLLNRKKCTFGVRIIIFFWFRISSKKFKGFTAIAYQLDELKKKIVV